jgi:four helix bundle protein
MNDFHKLTVWQKAHQLALSVYKATGPFPREEVYNLTSQMRRAATSIPTNIAEGCGRAGGAEFGHFLQIAMGSTCELEYKLLLACELHYIDDEVHLSLMGTIEEVKKMLVSLIQQTRKRTLNR